MVTTGGSTRDSAGGWSRARAVVWLGVACCAVYLGELSGPLLFDDEQTVVGNPTLTPVQFPRVLFAPRDTPMAGRPVANVSFAIGRAVLGDSATAHHAVNLALHLLVTLLGFWLVRAVLEGGRVAEAVKERAQGLSLGAGLLFAVHPIGVEIVLYATQRTEALMAVFYLAALWIVAAAARRRAVTPLALMATAVCSLLGACSKEVFATAPLMALFFDRAFFAGSFAQALRARGKLYVLLTLSWLPLLALQSHSPRPASVSGVSLDYLLAQAQIIPEYLGRALWPAKPVLDYGPLLPQDASTALPWAMVTVALVLVSTLLAFVRPQLGFLGVVVFGLLAPSSSLFTIHTEVGAERRLYLALVAITAYLVIGVDAWLRRALSSEAGRERIPRWLLLGAALAFGIQARAYAATFATLEDAWLTAVDARPDNPRAHYNLGETYRRAGKLAEAEQAYRAALERNEPYPDAHGNLGNVLLARGQTQEALRHLQRAVELSPRDVTARQNYGVALAIIGDFEAAEQQLRAAVELAPWSEGLRNKLARAQAAQRATQRGAGRTSTRQPPDAQGVHATAWPEVSLFAPRGTWAGADGAYSIDLGRGRTLWLWGDTFVDPAADGSRANGPNYFVRNGCAIQSAEDPAAAYDPTRAELSFYFGPERRGVPSSCQHEVDGDEHWLWPLHGARLPSGELLLFRMHVKAVKGGFGFALVGWDAVAVDDPLRPPDAWRPRVVAKPSAAAHVLVGSSVLVHGEHLYAYAAQNDPEKPGKHAMFLARYALSSLAGLRAGALDNPEWWCGRWGFVKRATCPAPVALFEEGQVEQSVHYDAARAQFVQLQMAGLFLSDPSTRVVMRTAPAPQGPWSEPLSVYRPSEASRADVANLVAYAAKAHPQITDDSGAVLLTYVVNDVKHMPPDDGLYYPRAVRLQLAPKQTGSASAAP